MLDFVNHACLTTYFFFQEYSQANSEILIVSILHVFVH
jgi:hypothetical protein